jgi:S-adenosylmethionine:tRNA ribosyltransferase-isomerase
MFRQQTVGQPAQSSDLSTAAFDYELPAELIAQVPAAERDACRLLTLDRQTGAIAHRVFKDLPDLLHPGDLLVLNDTRVLPARLYGRKPTGGKVEVLLAGRRSADAWSALTRPGVRVGQRLTFGGDLSARVLQIEPEGQRLLQFDRSGLELDAALHRVGVMPVPPYIREAPRDPEDYQTVFARDEGSIAAPTAGLHFTDELLARLRARSIELAFLTLHVGTGTFRPVKSVRVSDHVMHAEWFRISPGVADRINRARAAGRAIVAVGTTVVRTLESCADPNGIVRPGEGETSLFIVPGYRFRAVDALITNFHLPRSTLLMLVAAFAGREPVLRAYREAIAHRYRFYSFGDAMLIR